MIHTQEEVVKRLLDLDHEISQRNVTNLKGKVEFVIFGGSAFLFFTEFRFTTDIDIVFLQRVQSDELIHIMLTEYNINNDMQGIAGLPEGFEYRAYQLEGFENLNVYLPNQIDLIVSKLLRGLQKDLTDVVDSGILDQVDLNELRQTYNETKEYQLGHPNRFLDIEYVIEKYLEKKSANAE